MEFLVLLHGDGAAIYGKCRHCVSLLCARPGLSLVFAEIIARERRKNKVRTAAFCPRRDSISRISDKKKEIPDKLAEIYIKEDAKEIWSGKKATEAAEEVDSHGCVLYQMKRM